MKIIKLAECDLTTISQLAYLDELAVNKYGRTFSDEVWGVDNFNYQLPKKHEMSEVLIDDSGNAVGYCILSQKNGYINWWHRLLVANGGDKSLSGMLINSMLSNYPKVVGQVSVNHVKGIRLYGKHGFHLVSNYEDLYPHYPISLREFNAVISASKVFLVRDA